MRRKGMSSEQVQMDLEQGHSSETRKTMCFFFPFLVLNGLSF